MVAKPIDLQRTPAHHALIGLLGYIPKEIGSTSFFNCRRIFILGNFFSIIYISHPNYQHGGFSPPHLFFSLFHFMRILMLLVTLAVDNSWLVKHYPV